MKLVIRVDPETGEVYGKILRPGEKLPPLIKPKIRPEKPYKRRPKPS